MSLSINIKNKIVIVIGSGPTGLHMAQLLSPLFDEVIIVEQSKDINISPLSHFPHVRLIKGDRLLTKAFPTLEKELEKENAPITDLNYNFLWETDQGIGKRQKSNLISVCCSLSLLTRSMKKLVLKNKNVSIRTNKIVTGLNFSRDLRQVVSVSYKEKNIFGKINGDIIVNACGPFSNSDKWLSDARIIVPETITFPWKTHLTNCTFKFKKTKPNTTSGLIIKQSNPSVQGVIFSPIENDQILLSTMEFTENSQIDSYLTFQDYLQQFPSDKLKKILKNLIPVSPNINSFDFIENKFIPFKGENLPTNYFMLGSSYSLFNPILGLGLTNSFVCNQILQNLISKHVKTQFDYISSTYYRECSTYLMQKFKDIEKFHSRFGKSNQPFKLKNFILDKSLQLGTHSAYIHSLHLNKRHLG